MKYLIIFIINMNKQIFKKDIPLHLFYDFINDISYKNDNYYVINLIVYKRALYNNKIQSFLSEIKHYYHNSKMYYIEREITYNSFINVIRQICRFKNIYFERITKYYNSKYEINYCIFIDTIHDIVAPAAHAPLSSSPHSSQQTLQKIHD